MRMIHCAQCIEERPSHISARDYARFEIALYDGKGLLIACLRHQKPVFWCTPTDLEKLIHRGDPECDLCKRGIPHEEHN